MHSPAARSTSCPCYCYLCYNSKDDSHAETDRTVDIDDAARLADLESRIDALESREHIRHLVVRYAQALDSRDVQALAGCFTPDVRMGDGRVGRDALADWFDDLLRPYTTTFHFIGNHRIDLLDHDHANGVVYCRPEHEVGDQWIVMPMQYWDRYERQAGAWFFASRLLSGAFGVEWRVTTRHSSHDAPLNEGDAHFGLWTTRPDARTRRHSSDAGRSVEPRLVLSGRSDC